MSAGTLDNWRLWEIVMVRGVICICESDSGKVRSCFKIVFWPNVFVGASFKILEILMYACGFKLGSAATLVRLWRIEPKS
jgi:hypothetical protein